MANQHVYSYVQLAEAAEAPFRRHNLWAVVAECSVPRPTRGTDMVCNLTLVDPSTHERPDLAAGIEMMCFAPRAEQLPQLRRPGDIIRLHRVKMNLYHDKPQLVGKVGHGGEGFAFCLFDAEAAPAAGPGAAASAPYQSSHAHYHFDGREEQLLGALRHYLATLSRSQLGGSSTYLRRVKDVRPGQFFDLRARVVALDDSSPHFRLLHVWDGSDALPFPLAYDTREGEDAPDAQTLLPLLRPFALPLEDMPDRSGLPLVGTTLPVVFPKGGRTQQPPVGAWVKFRNLGARVVQGQLQAQFHRNSRWTPWQVEAEQAALMREYQQRLAENHTAGWAPDPRAAPGELLALCSHRDRPVSSLRQVLMDTPSAQPRCYRVLVRLLGYEPQDPASMCHPADTCGLPGPSDQQRWVYTLRLQLEDATGQLDAFLFGPDGDAFFADLPPRDLRADKAAAQELQRRLHVLLGQGCRRDGGPWMELCLKSYYGDPTHPWQTRQYRVFGATLQLPPPDGAAADVS